MPAGLAQRARIVLLAAHGVASWLNMVEIFLGIITRQAIRRGTFTSKTAGDILARATGGQKTSFTRR
jgi:hypothetical protein